MAQQQMYVWDSVRVLGSYYPGSVVVLTESKETAIDFAVQKIYPDTSLIIPGNLAYIKQRRDALRKELTETEPKVYAHNAVFFVYGGE